MITNSELPPEEPQQTALEDKLANLAELLQKGELEWHSRLPDILREFESFLVDRPPPPASWSNRVGDLANKFDYYQIVLPEEYINPYEDDLANVRLLGDKFYGQPGFMALEHALLQRNRFLFTDGHCEAIPAPRPLLMLEAADDASAEEDLWDCALTVFPDGSYWSYNLDRDETEELGEELGDLLQKHMDLLSRLRVVIPVEGVDFGNLQNIHED